MLEQILKLYTMFMATGVRSPLPHLIGPPGCGKSTVVAQAARLVQRKLHVINVSRISPLEIEGVQMPHTSDEGVMALKFLPATFWTQLQDGDILLLDEFLRGFPEVYNGLLDILTSREVGGFVLPKVFIIGASNTNVAYDKALEDRMLHLPVPDPRNSKQEKKRLAKLIVDELGLLPEMVDSMEISELLDQEVLPMYEILDSFKNGASSATILKGNSLRKLIGQAQLREVQSATLASLLQQNNATAMRKSQFQFVFLPDGKSAKAWPAYEDRAKQLEAKADRLTEVQRLNLGLNLQLIEMESIRYQQEGTTTNDDDAFDDDIFN